MVATHERAEAARVIRHGIAEDRAGGKLVQEAEGPDRDGHQDGEPGEDDIATPTLQADVQGAEQQPRGADHHHLPPGVHRRLRGIGGGERRVEARRQPAQVRLRADVELADVDAGHALLGPEGLAVDDHAPGVEILDGDIGEQRDARPERHRAEELAAKFGRRARGEVAGEQEGRDSGAEEGAGREADVVEPTIGPRRGALGGSAGQREHEAEEPDRQRDALRASFREDPDERGDGETERGGHRPEHHSAPAPRRKRQDESGEDHHGQFTRGEFGLGGH